MSFIKDFETYITEINEGLLKTYDIDFTINRLEILLSKLNIRFDVVKNQNNTISIKLNNYFDLKQGGLDYINNCLINLFGWFPSFIKTTNKNGMKKNLSYNKNWLITNKSILNKVELIYESKFDKTNKIPKFLYHLSIMGYKDKILKKGLCPKSKNKIGTHDNRIYVCIDPKHCYDLIEVFKFINYDIKNIDKKWIIYKIDTEQLDINLYDDPNFKDKEFYLLNNVPPESITIYSFEKNS